MAFKKGGFPVYISDRSASARSYLLAIRRLLVESWDAVASFRAAVSVFSVCSNVLFSSWQSVEGRVSKKSMLVCWKSTCTKQCHAKDKTTFLPKTFICVIDNSLRCCCNSWHRIRYSVTAISRLWIAADNDLWSKMSFLWVQVSPKRPSSQVSCLLAHLSSWFWWSWSFVLYSSFNTTWYPYALYIFFSKENNNKHD